MFHLRWITLALIVFAGLALSPPAFAETIVLREGGGGGAIDTPVDDTYLAARFSDNMNYGSDTALSVQTLVNGDVVLKMPLIAFRDMLSALPDEPIIVTSATLELQGLNTTPREPIFVYRVTTDWLSGSAGTNETNVTWNYANLSGMGYWASNALRTADGVGGFTTADFTTDHAASFTPDGQWGHVQGIDVTDIVQDMVDLDVNYGFALRMPDVEGTGPIATFASAEHATATPPTLTISYELESAANWQLAQGEFVPAKMPPVIVFPRPDSETHDWARHRRTYPGLEYRIPVAVQGGAWPFLYELTSAPQGMTIGSTAWESDYGIITWPNPTVGSYTVAVTVTDQELNQVSVTWTLVVTPAKTIFLSPTGNDANPGTITQPKRSHAGWHLDDTFDDTYQGYHVIMRGGTYPWAGMASRGDNIQIHDLKPLVFLAYPGETPVMDMSGGKFIANRAGSDAGTPDLYVAGITFENADQTRNNAHFFWLTGSDTKRVTLFDNTFRNIGPGQVGNDNTSVCFVSNTGTRKSYFAYIGNTYDTLGYSSNGVSLFDHYYTDYTVFEGNQILHVNSRMGAWSKSHNGWVTYRRNTGGIDRLTGDGGLFVFTPSSTTPNADAEFCWNYLTMNGTITQQSPAVIMFDQELNGVGSAWAYRNTIVGPIESRTAPSMGSPRLAENNVIITPANALKNFTDQDNLIGEPSDGIIDSSGALQGTYRTQYLGTRGWELPPLGQ